MTSNYEDVEVICPICTKTWLTLRELEDKNIFRSILIKPNTSETFVVRLSCLHKDADYAKGVLETLNKYIK